MTTLPLRPETIRDAIIAAYGYADPDRAAVVQNLVARFDDRGALGDIARYYIVKTEYRRATFRSVLRAQELPKPPWLNRNRDAAQANRQFLQATHETYHAWRRSQRSTNTAVNG